MPERWRKCLQHLPRPSTPPSPVDYSVPKLQHLEVSPPCDLAPVAEVPWQTASDSWMRLSRNFPSLPPTVAGRRFDDHRHLLFLRYTTHFSCILSLKLCTSVMTISSVYVFAIRSLMFPPSMHINQRSIYGVWGGFLSPYLGLWLYCFCLLCSSGHD